MYAESDELALSIGDIIQYESSDGGVNEGEVMGVAEEFDMVHVLPTSKLLRIPEWISAEDILSDDDIEFVME
jgi:hypothetical protein